MRVALDSGVFIRGILLALARPENYCSRILALAAAHDFVVVLCPRVEEEVRRVLRSKQREGALDVLLASCTWERTRSATEDDLSAHYLPILACVTDPPDARIGVEVRLADPPVDVFVSDNRADWKPSARLTVRLGGVVVMRPDTFLSRYDEGP